MHNIDSISRKARRELAARDEAREKMLPLCRDSIRYSGNAIRAVHRQEFTIAAELLEISRSLLNEAELAFKDFNDLGSTGIIRDAQKELAEANITLALVNGKPVPAPNELGIDTAAYLNGLGEAVGELRRYLLDNMRKGDLSRGEELLSIMDDIYNVLVTIDFPDAITGGLRRTTDMVRGILERTRSDLTLAIRQKELEDKLAVHHGEGTPPTVLPQQSPPPETTGALHQEEPALDNDEMKLYDALSAWRDKKAKEENLAPFIIARNSWLKAIIKARPSTLKQLSGIKGFGERRINKYGRDIIGIINRDQ